MALVSLQCRPLSQAFYYAYFVWCMCSRILVAPVMVLLHLLIIATNGLLSVLCWLHKSNSNDDNFLIFKSSLSIFLYLVSALDKLLLVNAIGHSIELTCFIWCLGSFLNWRSSAPWPMLEAPSSRNGFYSTVELQAASLPINVFAFWHIFSYDWFHIYPVWTDDRFFWIPHWGQENVKQRRKWCQNIGIFMTKCLKYTLKLS